MPPAAAQAPEAAYRTHPRYPLGTRGPLEQIGGNAVLSTLRRLSTEKGVRAHAHFGCEVETVKQDSADDRCGGAKFVTATHASTCPSSSLTQHLLTASWYCHSRELAS